LLLKRNKFIAEQYQKFIDNKDFTNFKNAIAADFALESIYFYNGFQFFYQLAARNKVANVAKMIKYIENDEVTHVNMFANIIREIFDFDNEEDKNIVLNNIMRAVEQEIEWGKEIYGDRILGISQESTENYIKYLANQRTKLLGLGVIYKGFIKNPYEYLNAEKRENFFETKVTEYSRSEAVDGWDDF
jgi:ribonucleoside-diphosphate reductase beta chain